MSPFLLKWLAIGLLAAGVVVFIYGQVEALKRKHYALGYAAMKEKHDAYAKEVEAAAAKAKADALVKEQERIATVHKAETTHAKKLPIVRGRGESERSRMRESADTGRRRVSEDPGATECRPGGGHLDELLRHGETLTRLLERADEQRLALEACRDAWPR